MTDLDDSTPPSSGDLDPAEVTLVAELPGANADQEIDKAVRGRRGVARKYVKWVRRRNPKATPAQVITILERHYVTAISTAGAAITVGTIAAEIGIAMIPVVGPAAAGGKAIAKEAAKSVALSGAKIASQRAVSLLPAGDEQLQFEITAVFALALAEIHGMDLDQNQAHALVYGLSNDRVSQIQIATMAKDLARSSNSEVVSIGHKIASGSNDWAHWANTLADSLPGGAAQTLVRGVQTGVLEDVRGTLGSKQQKAVEYGVGAVVGGVTRFAFGRQVVNASRTAFAEAPNAFPEHLAVKTKLRAEKKDSESNRALEALQDAGKTVSAGLATGALAVGAGVATAAGVASRPFRSVDLDGDGIPDEAQALTAAKGVGRAITGVAGGLKAKLSRGDKPKS